MATPTGEDVLKLGDDADELMSLQVVEPDREAIRHRAVRVGVTHPDVLR